MLVFSGGSGSTLSTSGSTTECKVQPAGSPKPDSGITRYSSQPRAEDLLETMQNVSPLALASLPASAAASSAEVHAVVLRAGAKPRPSGCARRAGTSRRDPLHYAGWPGVMSSGSIGSCPVRQIPAPARTGASAPPSAVLLPGRMAGSWRGGAKRPSYTFPQSKCARTLALALERISS